MEVHIFNSSTWEAGGSLCVGRQPSLQIEFLDSQGYTQKTRLKKPDRQTDRQIVAIVAIFVLF